MKKKKQSLVIFTELELDSFIPRIRNKIDETTLILAKFPPHAIRVNILANFFNSDPFKHINDERYLFWYIDNKYLLIDRVSIQHLVRRMFNKLGWMDYNNRAGNEVYNQIYSNSITDISLINSYKEIAPFNNGLYDLKKMEFLGPRPDMYFTRYFPVDYVESTDCPKFKAFINEILPYDAPRELVLVFLAYCFTSRVDLELSQFWTGGGNNGKSTLADIFSHIVGISASHVKRQRLLDPLDRFSLAFIDDKLVNFCSEVSAGKKMNADACAGFKRLNDKHQHGENKGADQFEWENTAKIVFLMNDLPMKTEYMDDSTFRRMMIIPFTVIVDKIIEGLSEIIFKAEGPQIAAYIMSFYPKVKTILKQNIELARDLWVRNTNTVFQFADFHCEISPIQYNFITPIYEKYVEWCGRVKKKPKVLKSFIHLLESLKMEMHQSRDEAHNIITTYGIRCKLLSGKIDGFFTDFPLEVITNE